MDGSNRMDGRLAWLAQREEAVSPALAISVSRGPSLVTATNRTAYCRWTR
jgi:hypothetical protein